MGEAGPTHQPIDQLMACRAIPNLLVLRPGDANEALVASCIAFEQTNRPALVLLTRQGLPVFDRNTYPSAEEFRRGGYVMQNCDGEADVVILATGSEVWVALDTMKLLESGANAIQLYTALIYEGPGLARKINMELKNSRLLS